MVKARDDPTGLNRETSHVAEIDVPVLHAGSLCIFDLQEKKARRIPELIGKRPVALGALFAECDVRAR